ncbi:hypothetical protein DHEL01_v212880 [Diaporthe helianthi]|uniref:Uncharacterized protein n=1 Tax=Diaporthe helianthi TaxID=158607 RepID=A0A2P5HEP8_DIAHE|nr:hypothetical protein DHEL01_v212880 [Diaporthe helianthi]
MLQSAVSGKGAVHMFREGGELVKYTPDVPDKQHGGDGAAQDRYSTGVSRRRGAPPTPLDLQQTNNAAGGVYDPEQPSPLYEPKGTLNLEEATGLSAQGRTLKQDIDDFLKTPPFPDCTTGAQDTSTNQETDSPMPPTATDNSGGVDSASTLTALAVDEAQAGAGHSSMGPSTSLSPMGTGDDQGDETSGDQRTYQHPQSTD